MPTLPDSANFAVVPVRGFRRIPLPDELGISAPDGYLLERYEVEVALDPSHESNRGIAGLLDAARTDGTVAVTVEVQLLAPADQDVSTLLVEIVNRGQAAHVPFDGFAVTAGRSSVLGPTPRALDADTFVLRERGAILWCGWQWDLVDADPVLLSATVPEVPPAIHSLHLPVTVTLVAAAPTGALPLFGLPGGVSPYAVDDLDDEQAELGQTTPDGIEVVVPRDRWEFTREVEDTGVVSIKYAEGFVPENSYRLTYRSSRCPVAGAAMLAVRDLVAFLRSRGQSVPSPLPAPPRDILGYGMSQGGRFLRQFLHDGRNADEHGKRVFDGLLVHAAGGRRSDLTGLHAQPSKAPPPADLLDGPIASGGLLSRSASAVRPRVLFTHTASEYWRGDAALTHLDPAAEHDLADPPHARHYLFAGLDHYGSRRPRGPSVTFPVNDVDAGLLLRAAYRALRRWVADGVEPPPSAVPRFSDRTAVRRSIALAQLRIASNVEEAISLADGRPPAVVSALDNGHNEVAGVRLPEVALPLAVLTGWNPRLMHDHGAPTTLAPLIGGRLSAAPTVRDPRTDMASRVGEHRCREIAEGLAARGLLLTEDVDECVRRAIGPLTR